MTLHNRYPSHRRLQARQPGKIEGILSDFFGQGFRGQPESTSTTETTSSSPTAIPTTTNTQGDNGSSNSSDNESSTMTRPRHHPPATTTPLSSSLSETSTPTFTSQPEITSVSTSTEKTLKKPAKTSTTSSSTSSLSSATSSSKSIPTSTLLKSTSIQHVISTAPAVTKTRTTDFVTPTTSDTTAIISTTPSATPSSGLSTGAIVGSVAGGIAGLVAIFFIVAFVLRRWRRNRIRDEDLNPEDFARGPDMTETGNGQNNNPFVPAPPNPAFRHHSIAPSISSGPNMAGQGTYAYGNDASYTGAAYVNAPYAAGGAAAYGTFEAHDDAINGAYSSDPRPQQAYNAEAYGSYAYSTNGSHAVTTGLQHDHPYQAHYRDNDPAPAPAHVPAPALVAGAPAVPANRAPSLYNVEDAYGGI